MILYIIPTYTCNLSCKSCYSKKYNDLYPEHMSWENFIAIYNKFSVRLQYVIFIGGEATNWKFINEAILFLKNKKVKTALITNGTKRPDVMPNSVTVNANNILIGSDSKIILENLNFYKMRGVSISLRYNIDSQFHKYLHDATQYGINYAHSISLSVLYPLQDNRLIVGDTLYNLAKSTLEKGIRTVISRATPLCLFTNEQRDFLKKNCRLRGTCSLPTNSLVINPDGFSAQPCVELEIIENINYFSIKEIMAKYKIETNNLKNYLPNICSECDFFKQNECHGGCLSYKKEQERT